ncbi:hypothetical protein [Vibrio phage vB_VpM-pA2SJ1]|uniref:Tail fiber protein n=1 Tax=Vibrio phage vB_VpM-pA2SJ1 TaxID=3095964 RepID=A0AAX4J5V3_9CAUD
MAILTNQVLGRNLDAEGTAKILNLAQLTLTNAAANDNEPLRKVEFDTSFNALDSRLTAVEGSSMHLDAVYVDTTSPDLNTALSNGSYADGVWTFGSKELSEGDLLILNAATEQDEARSWVHNGGTSGTAQDFTALASDIDAAIQSAVNAVIGTASNAYNTLGKAEALNTQLTTRVTDAENEIDVLQAQVPTKAEFKTAITSAWTDNGDGTYTAGVANPYNSTEVSVQVQADLGNGSWQYRFAPEFDLSISTNAVEIMTTSATLAANPVKLVMSGIVTP